MTDAHLPFLRAIVASPDDDLPRLAYADPGYSSISSLTPARMSRKYALASPLVSKPGSVSVWPAAILYIGGMDKRRAERVGWCIANVGAVLGGLAVTARLHFPALGVIGSNPVAVGSLITLFAGVFVIALARR